jgi:23S rRNA-/tRNA-specific pseudouridylate synthase
MSITLDKPPGLPVFPPHLDPQGDCLLRRLLNIQPARHNISWPNGFEGGIAHRLDNATSGAVLVADNLNELTHFRNLFTSHQWTKTYLLLTDGSASWDHHRCDKPIAHHPTKRSRMVVKRGENTPHRGRWYPVETHFHRVAQRLFEVTMRTGVTHQIRVHAAFLGIPIMGDPVYGSRETKQSLRDAHRPSPPLCLHHVGMQGPDGFRTDPVPPPAWVTTQRPLTNHRKT